MGALLSCGNQAGQDQKVQVSPGNSAAGNEQTEITGCSITNGRHASKIEYKNSRTNYTATYTLDVLVEDCMVKVIYFNNGGHLDDDHIVPAVISEDGHAFVAGENGKGYEVWVLK